MMIMMMQIILLCTMSFYSYDINVAIFLNVFMPLMLVYRAQRIVVVMAVCPSTVVVNDVI
jgi:hypothetical protein